MSGSAGIRGYYYQVLVGLLESVENDLWESISIEPSTEEDKVDIEWVFKDAISAVQVKSSINNFERGSVINWVHSLVKDAREAYEVFVVPISYTLFLIGTTDRNADKWISDLHGGRLEIKKESKLKEIETELSNVQVKKQNFDFEPLQALSYLRMQEYLLSIGKEAKLENIKTLCNVIVNELFTFSLQGRPMPKVLFSRLIDKHIDSGEYGINSIKIQTPELSLAFYEKGMVPESDQMIGIHLAKTPLLNQHRSEAIKLLKKVKLIKLPPSSTVEKSMVEIEHTKTLPTYINNIEKKEQAFLELNTEDSKLANLKGILSFDGYIKVQLSKEDIRELKDLSQSILGIELDDDDFHFGNLEKRAIDTVVMFGPPRNIPRGTEDEKDKYFAIKDAHYHLVSYQISLEYTDYLNTCYPIPIILINTGAIADEEILVTLRFPKTANVVTPEKIKPPYELFIEDFIHDDTVFNNLLIPARDYEVLKFEGTSFKIPIQEKLRLPFENNKYTAEDFIKHLKSLFAYEYFQEGDQDILQYEFKSLNPSHKMALPTFLLIQTDQDVIDIEYKITSKHLSRPIEGNLNWIHPDIKKYNDYEK